LKFYHSTFLPPACPPCPAGEPIPPSRPHLSRAQGCRNTPCSLLRGLPCTACTFRQVTPSEWIVQLSSYSSSRRSRSGGSGSGSCRHITAGTAQLVRHSRHVTHATHRLACTAYQRKHGLDAFCAGLCVTCPAVFGAGRAAAALQAVPRVAAHAGAVRLAASWVTAGRALHATWGSAICACLKQMKRVSVGNGNKRCRAVGQCGQCREWCVAEWGETAGPQD